ncbi:MAG: hypothetical protein HW382_1115 [Deltaproteobacteria bacterium]|nr:hypothetical protein [Deltaproteobacteria bacterium]
MMVEKTLREMRLGGIYDHIGFGFHRYSTDAKWLVPHFEKMLVLRDMTAQEGGFYSGEDADSEGKEGKFYLWTEGEIREVLNNQEAKLILEAFNLERGGNFIEFGRSGKSGENIFYMTKYFAGLAEELKLTENEHMESIGTARQKLFAAREERIHPHKDDKILTDWNGLMIAALAKGARVFDMPEYAEAARDACDFILNKMRKPDGIS